MPGAKSGFKPLSACESSGSASDEESHLDLHLQRQLEEDVARIFDESIYSDLEVVCGKLKILTHSCILKARTHKFYHKLETILRLNIERDTFDEIYSFISDAYTECNIQRQEKEFINYLNNTLSLSRAVTSNNNNTGKQKGFDDTDVFSTPHSTPYCVNPEGSLQNTFSSSIELNSAKNYKISSDVYSTIYPSNNPESAEQKPQSSSPSTELNKEYYALVPIEGNILEKELIEQDALSSAFKSFIKSQEDINSKQDKQCVKPTSLFLNSSHISKLNKHSDHCDIVKQFDIKEIEFTKQKNNSHNKLNNASSQVRAERVTDAAYSPDSLVTDEPSSSSDYLSATYTVSPGIPISECFSQINICEYPTKMENTFTVTDSGLETTGMLESLNSHKDVTLTDLSLTESTFLDMVSDEATNNHDTLSSASELKQLQKLKIFPSQHSLSATTSSEVEYKDIKHNKPPLLGEASGTSSKEEKQRQNEEIVILESSSLSSETGSWESVFPPKSTETEICQTFINSEREHMNYKEITGVKNKTKTTEITNITDELCPSLVQKSPFKSTSCFIDAASLADEGDETMIIHEVPSEAVAIPQSENVPITKCKPIACVRKYDQSPDDLSEGIDNEDSLEKADRDPDSIQKDESPTIFEMTPITEDSLCANGFENVPEQKTTTDVPNTSNEASLDISADRPQNRVLTIFSSTPNNSIISLRTYDANESEESENDSVISRRECNDRLRKQAIDSMMHLSESLIVSGGASVEDHLPQLNSHSGSPMCRRKVENMPIVSGAYVPIEEERPERSPRPSSNAAAWVVDMSCDTKPEINKVHSKPGDRACESLKLSSRPASSGDSCKSRSSVDSDSSERSTQKFYIDLSTLPDALPPERPIEEENNEKKNIFSLFIDLGDKTTVKEMPARLSSSIGKKKTAKTENKSPANQTTKSTSGSLKTTTVDESTFEKLESLCNDPNISITEIIRTRSSRSASANKDTENFESIISEEPRSLTNDIVESMIHEEAAPDNSTNDIFVKLSDLDKPVQISDVKVVLEKTHHFERMTRSIPENNWTETCSTNSRSVDIISSFHSENTLSLNRLFPHLKNDFSRSMPGCLSSRTRSPMRMGTSMSPGDGDEHVSDVSEMSSVQSSMCRSIVENSTTEETSQTASLISSCQSRLGQDLLRMFLEEIAPDVIVEVSGRRIKAHKCILSSRCQYFAAMLSGGWVESAGNVIVLPPFSFSVVHFALCHIYSGVSMIPDSISIVELATIADMLGLEGLKEAIMFTLKAKYCHHFHKPCQVCTAGVLECFPLSSVYGLDDLYRKCLRWITKYFHKVWPTKAFATLPSELLDKCYQEHIINLTTDNFVDTVYGCGMTVASLQSSRWADVVARMCRRLINAAAQFAAARLAGVLRALAEHPLGAPRPATQALHDCLSAAIEWAPPDEACKAYAYLSNLVYNDHFVKPDLIANGNQGKSNNLLQSHAASWQLQCEGALVRAAPRVVGSQAFKELPNELRKRLRELGCIMFGQALPLTPSPLSIRKARSPHRKTNKSHTSRSLDIDQVRASFVPYAPKPQPLAPGGSLDLLTGADQKTSLKSNKTAPPQVRTTKAQEKRAKYNLIKTFQPPTSVAPGKTGRLPYENTKPRYLEPRVAKENERSVKKPVARMVSSSESSRNSSPLVGRARDKFSASRDKTSMSYDKTSVTRDKTNVSHDSLATSSRPRTADPSTDSLSESNNKYATYTKSKYQTKRSTESIQSAKHYQNSTSSNKAKSTKIPVYLKNAKNPPPAHAPKNKNSGSAQDRSVKENRSSSVQPKQNERKPSCSLMNATKSSIAKIVPKVLKESPNKTYTSKSGKGNSKQGSRSPPQEIPIMERSGTFLKDEPMFGDKTTNIDIDD